jgi:hypothetical protein
MRPPCQVRALYIYATWPISPPSHTHLDHLLGRIRLPRHPRAGGQRHWHHQLGDGACVEPSARVLARARMLGSDRSATFCAAALPAAPGAHVASGRGALQLVPPKSMCMDLAPAPFPTPLAWADWLGSFAARP